MRSRYDWTHRIAWLVTPPLLFLVVWGVWFLGAGISSGGEWVANQTLFTGLSAWFFPGGWNPLRWTGWAYVLLIGWLAFGVISLLADDPDLLGAGIGGLVVAMLCCLVMMLVSVTGNGVDEARAYSGTATAPTTIFLVRDPGNAPSFVRDLTDDADPATDGPCELIGRGDVTGCVDRGDLTLSWEPRVVSISAAKYQMKTNSASVANTELRENTTGYLYRRGEDGALQVKVSAVRDGKEDRPLHSIVEWNGRGNPTSCLFAGRYALDTSFNGTGGANLRDLLARRYANLHYEDDDIWGYCDGAEPKVVVPVTRQLGYRNRTVTRPAGVLIISGRDGKTHLDHRATVGPGDLPGPSYPISTVIKQRELSAWATGREPDDDGGFGFELTAADTQQDNVGVFQLMSKDDGRRYWVSPLRARGSDSEQLVAYSVTPADTVSAGSYNTQRIYVLDDNDARITALPRLENRIKAVLSSDPGFYPAGGRVIEFLPLDGGTWQAYGEVDGQVKYVFTVPVDESRPVTVTNLAAGAVPAIPPPTGPGAGPPAQPGADPALSPCADFARATREQLRECAYRALEEDRRRAAAEGAGQPSGR